MHNISESKYRSCKGLTLVELMAVTAIIGILTAVAYSSFEGQQDRGYRSEAISALMGAAQELEACARDNNGSYNACVLVKFLNSENNRYNLTITNQTATSYTLNAIPVVVGGDLDCTSLTLTHIGVKGFTGSGTQKRCWSGS